MSRTPKNRNLSEDCNRRQQRNSAAKKPSSADTFQDSGWTPLAAATIVAIGVLAYSNTFRVPFIFDDAGSTVDNPTIRRLWPVWPALLPPHTGATVDGRPVLNLSLAVNYSVSALEPWSYHVVNITIHILAALVLLGVIRRTLTLPGMPAHLTRASTALAILIALIWAVHPLQTESVTYMIQRAESLVSLFYLLTLYCSVRGVGSPRSVAWSAAAVVACTLGMASKEVMVSAPLLALLYDRTFLAGSFRKAIRKRWGLYGGLAATWILLVALVIGSEGRGGTAGFGLKISPWEYALTQCRAMPHYLRLSLWPTGLCLDYGDSVVQSLWSVLPQAIGVVALVALTFYALWRWPVVGFLDAFFLAVLAPTSSIVPVITQTVAEHRMYLPLAAVVTGVVIGTYLLGRWFVRRKILSLTTAKIAGGSLAVLAVGVLAVVTFHRNADYGSDLSIWHDTVVKVPGNSRAHLNLGVALMRQGRNSEAMAEYQAAIKLNPKNAEGYSNIGNLLAARGRTDEAITQYRKALGIKHDYADAHCNLGVALAAEGRTDEAIDQYRRALNIKHDDDDAHCNLGVALAAQGRTDEAITEYREALKIKHDHVNAHCNLGVALAKQGRIKEAIAQYHAALNVNRDDAATLNNLAWLRATYPMAAFRDGAEAVELAQRASHLSDGRDPAALDTLAAAYAEAGRFPEAVQTAQKAIGLAKRQNNEALAERVKARMRLYEARTPYREHSSGPTAQ